MRRDFLPYGRHEIDEKDIREVVKSLRSGWVTTGPKIDEFEESFRDYVGCEYAVAVSSGTAALDVAVGALDLPAGSEVITTPFTFVATANAALYNRCKPVFADIQDRTHNIDPERVEEKITENTGAIICVDFAGRPCDLKRLRDLAGDRGIPLIEDASHACGAEYKGRKVGSVSDLTTFSFHPVKHITTGEGGMVTTDDRRLYEKMRMLRNHGIDRGARERFGPDKSWEYDMKLLGRNYRMTDFQAALGLSQLRRLDGFIRKRSSLAEKYGKRLGKMPQVTIPSPVGNAKHAWHLYTVLLNGVDRDRLFGLMRKRNIGVNVHYIPVYRHTYYRENFGYPPEDFPVTEDTFKRTITLPLFANMSPKDVKDVVDAVEGSLQEMSP